MGFRFWASGFKVNISLTKGRLSRDMGSRVYGLENMLTLFKSYAAAIL